jgi:penicillin amidase
VKGVLYPGYFAPESRSRRITDLLEAQQTFTPADMRRVITDANGFPYPKIAAAMAKAVQGAKLPASQQAMLDTLARWDGNHNGSSTAPTIYYHLTWQVVRLALEDQIGEEMTEEVTSNFLMMRSLPVWINNSNSRWWDDIHTPARETLRDVVLLALGEAEKALTDAGGDDPADWRWDTFHTLELVHPVGRAKPFNLLFNVGPVGVPGGKEVINNTGFSLRPDENGHFPALYGPSKRIIIDFADVEAAVSVLPSGQSGHLLSPHYADQFPLYTTNQFRPMLMNRAAIEKTGKKLVVKP